MDFTPRQPSSSSHGNSSKRKVRRQGYQVKEYRLPMSPSVEEVVQPVVDHYQSERPVEVTSRRPTTSTPSLVRSQISKSTRVGSVRGSRSAHSPAIDPKTVGSGTFKPSPSYSTASPNLAASASPALSQTPVLSSLTPQTSPAIMDSRFEAFMARVGRSPTALQPLRRQLGAQPAFLANGEPMFSRASQEMDRSKSPELDKEFILQFAKEHDLELADEISKEMIGGEGMVRKRATEETKTPTTHTPSVQDTDATPQIMNTTKPPRPPRSERRVSRSPRMIPTFQATSSLNHIYDDAEDESLKGVYPSDTFEPDIATQRSSLVSPHLSPPLVSPPSTGMNHALGANISYALALPGPDSGIGESSFVAEEAICEALSSAAESQTQDDYERDRRLSSLFHGLGIHSLDLGVSTPQETIKETRDSMDDGSMSGSHSGYSDSFASAEEGNEDVWGHNYPDEEGDQQNVRPFRQIQSSRSLRRQSTRSSRRQSQGFTVRGEKLESTANHNVSRQSSRRSTRSRTSTANRWQDANSQPPLQEGTPSRYEDAELPVHSGTSFNLDRPSSLAYFDAQRQSMGYDDSVLAAILASESFCLPEGVQVDLDALAARYSSSDVQPRMSVEQLRSRMSIEYLKRASTLQKKSMEDLRSKKSLDEIQYKRLGAREGPINNQNSPTGMQAENTEYKPHYLASPQPPSSAGDYSRPSSIAISGRAVSSTSSHSSWNSAGTPITEASTPFTEEHHSFIEEKQPLAPSNAIEHIPLPECLPPPALHEVATRRERQPSEAPSMGRARSMSIDIFQKLSSSFSSSATKSKGRKRMPSFFGGGGGQGKQQHIPVVTMMDHDLTAPSSNPSAALVTAATSSATSSMVKRKRAYTGPASLLDIANMVTGTPSLPRAPTQPAIGPTPASSRSWRSTIPDSIYEEIAKLHTKHELRRQEVIAELCQTEDAFVNGLRGVVRVFSQPLRTPQGRWIAGIPVSISQLLDWLDAIVLLHQQLCAALHQTRANQGAVVLRIADAFLPFIPKLDVHQPYLIKFESVTREIEELSTRHDSEFGEFVRIQQALPECGAMTLSSFLLKPVQRLMKYPLFFKQLSDLTPPNHPDHASTQTLFEICDNIIRIMQEVKVREEEYDQIKSFCSRIIGLPTGMNLARRDRRLLAQGPMKRVHISDKDRAALDPDYAPPSTATISLSPDQSQTSLATLEPGGLAREALARGRTSSFAHTNTPAPINLNAPPTPLYSPLSPRPLSFLSDAPSHDSGISSLRPMSIASSKRPESITSFSAMSDMSAMTGSSASSFGYQRQRQQSSSAYTLRTKAKESSVHVFIFSDLVVFATKQSEGIRGGLKRVGSKRDLKTSNSVTSIQPHKEDSKGPKYRVVDDWGVAKITGVVDHSGRTEHEHLLQVDLLPIWSEKDARSFSPLSAGLATSVFLSISESTRPATTAGNSSNSNARHKERQAFLNAFEQSHLTSVRAFSHAAISAAAVSQPMSRSDACSGYGYGSGGRKQKRAVIADPRSSMASFVEDGMPIPKSPSMQQMEGGAFDREKTTDKEGQSQDQNAFWSMRVKKVQRDMMQEQEQLQLDYHEGEGGENSGTMAMMEERIQVEQGFFRPSTAARIPPTMRQQRQRTMTGASVLSQATRRPR